MDPPTLPMPPSSELSDHRLYTSTTSLLPEHPLALLGPLTIISSFCDVPSVIALACSSTRAWKILRDLNPKVQFADELFVQQLQIAVSEIYAQFPTEKHFFLLEPSIETRIETSIDASSRTSKQQSMTFRLTADLLQYCWNETVWSCGGKWFEKRTLSANRIGLEKFRICEHVSFSSGTDPEDEDAWYLDSDDEEDGEMEGETTNLLENHKPGDPTPMREFSLVLAFVDSDKSPTGKEVVANLGSMYENVPIGVTKRVRVVRTGWAGHGPKKSIVDLAIYSPWHSDYFSREEEESQGVEQKNTDGDSEGGEN